MRRMIVLAVGFALALPGAAIAAAVASGDYAGTSSQSGAGAHYLFRLVVAGGKITGGVYKANYRGHTGCSSYSGSPTRWGQGIKGGKAVKITNGKFSASDRIAPADYLNISGKFVGSTVTGSFDETFTAGAVVSGRVREYNCTSGKVTFTATLP